MECDATCLINVFLAFFALVLYGIGSYCLYIKGKGAVLILGIAIFIDVVTAVLASFKITPTVQIPGMVAVPWNSALFCLHVVFSMIGFLGFIILFIYLLVRKNAAYKNWIRKWQFYALLPVWVIGELIALSNALLKIVKGVRLFELV